MRIILDTNVVISALVSRSKDRPPGQVLGLVLRGRVPLLVSDALLKEYGQSLRKSKVASRHHLQEGELSDLLQLLAARSARVEPGLPSRHAPDLKDDHLWALLEADRGATLVTGERALLESSDFPDRVISARGLIEQMGPGTE